MSSPPLSAVVREVVKEALERSGKAQALATKVQALVGRPYNFRTVSSWSRGDAMPPGDALLAAAQVAGISLDEKLRVGRESSDVEAQIVQLREDITQLRQQVAALEVKVMDAEAAQPGSAQQGDRPTQRREHAG